MASKIELILQSFKGLRQDVYELYALTTNFEAQVVDYKNNLPGPEREPTELEDEIKDLRHQILEQQQKLDFQSNQLDRLKSQCEKLEQQTQDQSDEIQGLHAQLQQHPNDDANEGGQRPHDSYYRGAARGRIPRNYNRNQRAYQKGLDSSYDAPPSHSSYKAPPKRYNY